MKDLGLEVTECGRGRDVVLVHGSASDLRTWHAQREAWCDAFHLVAYSRRYHWPNERIEPGENYSLHEHVADLAALMRELGSGPASLGGHSYGGLICLALAAR